MALPETQYAKTVDGLSIAYQCLGAGPPDVVFVRAWHTNVEHDWDERVLAHTFRRIGSFGRLILFDRRGSGLSDAAGTEAVSLDAQMDDLTAVLDATGSTRADLVGLTDAGTPLCALFAASHPNRVDRLVLYNPHVRELFAEDYPWGSTLEESLASAESMLRDWGQVDQAAKMLQIIAPSRAEDAVLAEWLATSQRRSMPPQRAHALLEAAMAIDVRDVLPAIRCPTLVIHRGSAAPLEESEWVAGQIPSCEFVDLQAPDHMFVSGDTDAVIDVVERFLTGHVRTTPVLDRQLASLLFTDIAASTEELTRVGDRGWTELVQRHHQEVRRLIAIYRGIEVDTAGDGFFVSFDGPARAVRCAVEIISTVGRLGLRVRAGVHTGECDLVDGKPAGHAVVVGARAMARAEPGTILVTSTVKDLTAGSGIEYDDAGQHALKGLSDAWHLYRVQAPN